MQRAVTHTLFVRPLARLARPTSLGIALLAGLLLLPILPGAADAQWVVFLDETGERLSGDDEDLTIDDDQEKDYAWGDVDMDGDIDLICVRKQPFTSAGRRTNVLFLNEGVDDGWDLDGVLVDRTEDYATASDVDDDEGFLTATNDRDVILVDVDGDDWLDIVTATTNADLNPFTQTTPEKHISHPRIYMNLGEDDDGEWLGFEYQDARFPEIFVGDDEAFPCFCSVAAGDVDGDGSPDLYFGDYDSGCELLDDVNDRLFLNDGDGFFTDETADSFEGEIDTIEGDFAFTSSAFGAAVAIVDLNDDGDMDIVKQTSLIPPQYVGVAYGDGSGVFDADVIGFDAIDEDAPYFISIGDLNDDGMLDVVITDDGLDHFYLHEEIEDGIVDFNRENFQYEEGSDDGFGGNSVIADLNNDGFNDVIICDVDVDEFGCGRRLHIYRNLGDTPTVTLQEQGGAQDWTPRGVHDVALIDLNDDSFLDMVIGTCDGTEVWINDPPIGLRFLFPDGVPFFVTPDEETTFRVEVEGIDKGVPEPGTAALFVSVDGADFEAADMTEVDDEDNVYDATLPAMDCSSKVRFYFTAETEDGEEFSDPSNAPDGAYSAIAAFDTSTTVDTGFDEEPDDWETDSFVEGSGTPRGEWEWTDDPVGTFDALFDTQLAPDGDAEQDEGGAMFVTANGTSGGLISANDVDGITTLTTGAFDLSDTDAQVSFVWWFASTRDSNDEAATLSVQVSDDGEEFVEVASTELTGGWETVSFLVSDYVEPSATVHVRWVAKDDPNTALAEAALDNFTLSVFVCEELPEFVRGDANDDGTIDISDPIAVLLYQFADGTLGCEKAADADDSGTLGVADALWILDDVFGDGMPTAEPSDCGNDPSLDDLGCEVFESCL